jgi:hypothetical protein
MEEETTYSPRMYWHYVRRHRVKAKLFALYRAIPSLVIATVQFIWSRRGHSIRELSVSVGIICGVYLGIFIVETVWNLIVLTPPIIYAEQIEVISELLAKNSFLERERKTPAISPQEQRRRELVSKEVKKLDPIGRAILRYIHDQGQVSAMALKVDCQFTETDVSKFIAKAIPGGLIVYQNHIISIKPDLKAAVEFVLSTESTETGKDQ